MVIMTQLTARITAGHYRFRNAARMEWIKLRPGHTLTAITLPWLVLPPAVLLAVSVLHPAYVDRYILFSLPALSLLTAAGSCSPHCSPESTRTRHEPVPGLRLTRPGQLPSPEPTTTALDVITDAIDSLAQRRTPYWPGDSAVRLHALASLITQAEQLLPRAVHDARDQELTWTRSASSLAPPPPTAARHYRNTP
jgi:hypothetical protein